MKWEVLYTDWTKYTSEEHKWEDLPELGVQKIWVYMDDGSGTVVFSGWDVYWMRENEDGSLDVGTWNDDDLEVANYEIGCVRTFYKDGNAREKVEYLPHSTWSNIPLSLLKRGELVDEETAKLMGHI